MAYSVFLDLDGTLLPSGWDRISDRTLAALNSAHENGHRVFLNTGRPLSFLPFDAFRGFRFDGYLCGCAYANIGGKVILADGLSADQTEPVAAHFFDRGITVLLEGEEATYAAYDPQRSTGFLPLDGIDAIFHVCEIEPITKMNILKALDGEDLEFIREFGDPIVRPDADCTELVPHGHSKATLMAATLDYLGLDPQLTLAVGDTTNDIPMLDAAAISVAMGNASDEVKRHADHVTSDCEADGAAEALETYLK